MTLTPNDDSQPKTSQKASSLTGSSTAPTSETTLSATSISSSTDTQRVSPQEHPNGLYRFFHPSTPFPIMAKGVILYALWNRPPGIPASLAPLPSEIKQNGEGFGPWYMIRLIWQPRNVPPSKAYIDEPTTINALTIMVNYIDTLADAQANNQGSDSGVQLVYQLLQIQEIKLNVPRFYRLRTLRLHYYMSKQEMQQAITNVRRRGFVRTLQKHFHLLEVDTSSGLEPSTFGHYDRNTHSRGWIVLNPARALLVGVDTSAVRIFAGLLQRRDIDQTKQRGIALDRYDDVIGRVSLWNAAQDINETVDQLANLASSGQKSTDGQVLLSLTLAIIGILVAFTPSLHFSAIHIWGTFGLLSLASILFWRYAHSGKAFWLLLGLLSIVCVLILDIIPV